MDKSHHLWLIQCPVLAILIITHTIKLLIDIIIQGYSVHSIYGLFIRVLGAVWGPLSLLLLYLGKADKNISQDTN